MLLILTCVMLMLVDIQGIGRLMRKYDTDEIEVFLTRAQLPDIVQATIYARRTTLMLGVATALSVLRI